MSEERRREEEEIFGYMRTNKAVQEEERETVAVRRRANRGVRQRREVAKTTR